MTSPLAHYVAKKRRTVSGWLSRLDAEIFRALLEYQSERRLSGSVAEIGVHEGKSFVALCLSLGQGEKAYCIDVFDNQNLNKDKSGRGDRQKLELNLVRFGIELSRTIIDPRSSKAVTPADIVTEVGPVRFFSIDGGHWKEIVVNDLCLAEHSIADHGIIALDDFHRPEWPEVSMGYFSWMPEKSIVPFAIGFNKLYLCGANWAAPYETTLREDSFVRHFFKKDVMFKGRQIPIFQEYLLPEFSIRQRILANVRLFKPDLYLALKVLRSRRRK